MLWTLSVEGGPKRVNHASVGDEEKNLVFSFGGYCTGVEYNSIEKMDIHVFNGATLQWYKLKTPTKDDSDYNFVPFMRYGHTASLISDLVYIFGGRNDVDGACNKLFCFNTDTLKWSQPSVKGVAPEERDGHSACVIGTKIYIFGGFKEMDERFASDLHFLETKTMTWHQPSQETPSIWRDFHTATAIGTKMYVFGGRENLKWSKCSMSGNLPLGRRSHSAMAYKGSIYIFGGYNGELKKHFADMWRFDPEKSTWSRLNIKGNPPCARRRQSLTRIGDKAVLFGGTCPICNQWLARSTRVQDADEVDENLSDLQDLSDVYILDLDPSLKTLAKRAVFTNNIDCKSLPRELRIEIESMKPDSQVNRVSLGMTQG
eukprot:gene17661-19419_t